MIPDRRLFTAVTELPDVHNGRELMLLDLLEDAGHLVLLARVAVSRRLFHQNSHGVRSCLELVHLLERRRILLALLIAGVAVIPLLQLLLILGVVVADDGLAARELIDLFLGEVGRVPRDVDQPLRRLLVGVVDRSWDQWHGGAEARR